MKSQKFKLPEMSFSLKASKDQKLNSSNDELMIDITNRLTYDTAPNFLSKLLLAKVSNIYMHSQELTEVDISGLQSICSAINYCEDSDINISVNLNPDETTKQLIINSGFEFLIK